jgi:hypothetical protein
MSGPLLTLLSQGLRFWLASVCTKLEKLELQLDGSALDLIGGRLEGAKLKAEGVVFQGLSIAAVELESEMITFNAAGLLKGRNLEFKQRFRIYGKVKFNEEGLTKSLQNPYWRNFSNDLASTLLSNQELKAYEIKDQELQLIGNKGKSICCYLKLINDELYLQHSTKLPGISLENLIKIPLDPAIKIENIAIDNKELILVGNSLVSAGAAKSK